MNRFCTYFDRGYLPQGLALWRSLLRHEPSAVLWVLCLDDETMEVLQGLDDPRLHLLSLAALLALDRDLQRVRSGRPRQEFIFSLTPCLVSHLLRTLPEAELITYLDADLLFFSTPMPISHGLGAGSVLVVPHRYPDWHDDAELYGRYNVGVLVFRADDNGRSCVNWWRERCLESCSLQADGTRYGDQKYLDQWPRRFGGVVELEHPGVNLAPWNWSRFQLDQEDGGAVRVDGVPLVVFHFAQFRRISDRWFDSGQLEYGIMPLRMRSRIYGEYWRALEAAEVEIRRQRPDYSLPKRGWTASLGSWRMALLRLFWGQFWLKIGRWWLSGRLGFGRLSGPIMGRYRRWQRRRI
jgi:hypothetical protein